MTQLANKHILLGVTGSIAAYKAADLVRRLREAGAEVRVVMTAGAGEFVTPMTFQAVSGHPVHQHLLDADAEAAMGHIELARWADAIIVAPASADFLARLAQGRADDLLSAVCLAAERPLAVAPAMNTHMWANPATGENVRSLQKRGVLLIGPEAGEQACGDVGAGRMSSPESIITQLADLFSTGSLTGRTLLITAGPTREAIDPVRYLSNHSSGKMGFALAEAAVEAGARVILVSGPVNLATPAHVERLDVVSAQQMAAAVDSRIGEADIFIATAAVADYRPRQVPAEKIKKDQPQLTLELEKNPDILAGVKQQHPGVFCVGFAAETTDLERYARAKLDDKRLEMVVANLVGSATPETEGTFGSETNVLQVFWPGGETHLPLAPKGQLARQLIPVIVSRYEQRDMTAAGKGKIVELNQAVRPKR
ncbi:bifunctional phosphopantothenoylcysteine decarboxylase/phosphopantothenate--cysteine ligase CoaBC [Thiohalophilus thiocyanatoxydans]|uniref:Coenzyme A biosynthesis bifunctional protein CoaBC n=1 Tax=Thiohalophilus thiocyanatoxydans TaxID=381308 RepID=A0A4R8J1E1_9GAMM|nr:bifunctional phosphopantothenoylcysteine decarboxylase/phosphopantothenate--cysteine ligase CoaBC [Thiohalophilus thiocyanatoxydans]TDY04127.1 phosphopantothenoylcysteine decarboxylase/phosphopantothenate--cysteine ligase [Thiohalophilus thiocyanatoxydans]